MRIFGSDKISGLMQKLGMEEGQEIEHPLVTRAVETAQKRVEMRNFEIRKHLIEYDDVMNRQREIIYEERNRVLEIADLTDHVLEMVENVVDTMIVQYVNPEVREEERNEDGFKHAFQAKFGIEVKDAFFTKDSFEEFRENLVNQAAAQFRARIDRFGAEKMHFLERYILLHVIDAKWKDHLRAVDELREGIGLRAYGQRNPLVEYKQESFDMFEQMVVSIKEEAIEFLFKVQAVREEAVIRPVSPSKQQYLHPEASGMTAGPTPGAPGVEESPPYGLPPAAQAPRPLGRSSRMPDTVRRDQPKVGRNEPCPCGSGKKYKKCHGA